MCEVAASATDGSEGDACGTDGALVDDVAGMRRQKTVGFSLVDE